jgi:predicted negative regulator of RcsB-dependent stress response
LKQRFGASNIFARRSGKFAAIVVLILIAADGCAPRPPYRSPAPPSSSAPATSRAPQPPSVVPPAPEIAKRPLPQEAKIREQDLKSRQPSSGSGAKEASRDGRATTAEPVSPPLPDDSSLLAKITPATAPQRAASLRLTEEGRKLLDAGDPQKALTRLEKTIVIDSTNSYGYFYLAKAQYRMGRYKESLNFLDVTESQLSNKEPFWLAEVHALRGENYRALGMMQQAEASYAHALRLNSGNRTAAEAISRLQGDSQPASR